MKLLIVDDSNIMRRAIQSYTSTLQLELAGTASNGEEAIKLFKEIKPEVVTLDITLPGVDGLTCLEVMLKFNPDTTILIVSALTSKAVALKALKLGAKGFLNKPFTQKKIIEALSPLLKQRK